MPGNESFRAAGRETRQRITMAQDLRIYSEVIHDLLCRLQSPSERDREEAVESLRVIAEDEGWRPEELVRQEGIELVIGLLEEDNTHIVAAAIDIISAAAAAGAEEELLSAGAIPALDAIRDHENPEVRKKAQAALWLLEPSVGDVVMTKPQDEY